jgi:hypothetical protein
MPMYYFHQQDGTKVAEDLDGSELPDLQAARQYAVKAARELLGHAIRFDHSAPERIFIVDEDGDELLTVFITEVLPASLKKRFHRSELSSQEGREASSL